MSRKTQPSEALLKDLHEVFERHNWSGNAIGLAMSATSRRNITASNRTALTESVIDCGPGKIPQPFKFQKPDGTWVFGTRCVDI